MFGQLTYWGLLSILILLLLRRPYYGYCAFLCVFGLEQWGQLYVPLLRQVSYLSNILILIPIWFVCFTKINKAVLGIRWNGGSQRFLIFLLYLYAAFSLIWTFHDVDGWSIWSPVLPYILTGIVIVPLCLKTTNEFFLAQKGFIFIGGTLMLLLAFVPEWGARSIMIEGSGGREKIGLPLALGELAGYILITAGLQLKKSPFSIAIFAIATVGALVVAIKSGSRGPLIFSVLAVMFVMPMTWKGGMIKKYFGIAFIGLVFAFVIVEIFTSSAAYSDRWELSMILADFGARFYGAELLLNKAYSSPISILFGLGNSASFSKSLLGMYPHMIPLEILAEEGLIGIGLWIAIVISAVRQLKLLKILFSDNIEDRKVFLAIFACFLFSILLSFKQGSLVSFSVPFVFVALQERFIILKKYENKGA